MVSADNKQPVGVTKPYLWSKATEREFYFKSVTMPGVIKVPAAVCSPGSLADRLCKQGRVDQSQRVSIWAWVYPAILIETFLLFRLCISSTAWKVNNLTRCPSDFRNYVSEVEKRIDRVLVEGTFLISVSELVTHKIFHVPHYCEPLSYAINEKRR